MGFREMIQRGCQSDNEADYEPMSDDEYNETMHLSVMQQIMASHSTLHPDWKPTIYFNRAFAEDEDVLKVADSQTSDVYQDWLSVEALEYHPVFKFPQAERLFLERGYVREDDLTAFPRGQHSPHIVFLDVNLSALRTQFFVFKTLLAEILKVDGPYQFDGTKSWNYAAFMGGESGNNADQEPVLLAERDGVLLPWIDQSEAYLFHLAYAAIDDTVRVQPMDIEKHFGDQHEDRAAIKVQILRELANSTQYFHGATPIALTLWHSQILAYLRKIVARIEVECGAYFNAISMIAENENKKLLLETRERLAEKSPFSNARPTSTFQLVSRDVKDQVSERALEWKAAGRQFNSSDPSVVWHVTELEKLRASAHGATYFDLDTDRFDPMGDAFTMAAWVGKLKRTRHARFSIGMASCLDTLLESLELDIAPEIDTALFHSLGKNVWETLVDIASELRQSDDTQLEYDVHYQWIGDDASMLWQVNRDGRSLTIIGPLLDFPVDDVQFWNGQADRLVAAGRFGI